MGYGNFIIISYAVLALIIVILVLGKKGREEDNNLRRMKSIGKDVVQTDYKNVDTSFYDRVIKPLSDKFRSSASKTAENNKQVVSPKTAKQQAQQHKIERQLRQAGLHVSASNYQFFKMGFFLICSIVFVGMGLAVRNYTQYYIAIMGCGVVVGFIGPDFYLKARVTSHQNAIKSQLPDTLDLLSVCMEAGLSFDASLLKVSERMEGPFIDELMTVFRQIQMGKSRNEALKNLSDSTDIPELKTLLSSLMQANTLGIPVSNVMKIQSEQLRNNRKMEIKEKAGKIPSKMTLPTVMFILPTIFIVILAPIVFSIMDSGALSAI